MYADIVGKIKAQAQRYMKSAEDKNQRSDELKKQNRGDIAGGPPRDAHRRHRAPGDCAQQQEGESGLHGGRRGFRRHQRGMAAERSRSQLARGGHGCTKDAGEEDNETKEAAAQLVNIVAATKSGAFPLKARGKNQTSGRRGQGGNGGMGSRGKGWKAEVPYRFEAIAGDPIVFSPKKQ